MTSVVSESFPHLRRGAMRDFVAILESQNAFYDDQWNKTEYIYTLENGSQIEFFSADQPAKVRGPRRDRLFLNEANNIPFEIADQLIIRTNEFIYADWNPVNEFWAYTEARFRQDDVERITLTYKDNEGLAQSIVEEIERHKDNKRWWGVYGLGQLGSIKGIIYPENSNWWLIDEVPRNARLERRWLDYGYSNDPTAIGDLYKYNDAYVLDEVLYQKGLSNKNIADVIKNQPEQVPVSADSAEPKSNDELATYDITVIPAKKGADSVNFGIQVCQQQKLFVTKRSVNIIKELRNYLWQEDKEGKIINVPIPIYNHHMDGMRYAFSSLLDFMPDSVRVKQSQRMNQNEGRRIMSSTR